MRSGTHYRANYRPQDLVISVAGAVDHDELVGWVTSALETAGWNLHGRRRPGHAPRRGARPDRSRLARSRSSTGRSSRPTSCSGSPGLAATDQRRSTLVRAQLGARRRDVVAALPGGPREARPGLLGLLVRAPATPTPASSACTPDARRKRAGTGRRTHAVRVPPARRRTASPMTSSRGRRGSSGERRRSPSRTPTPA